MKDFNSINIGDINMELTQKEQDEFETLFMFGFDSDSVDSKQRLKIMMMNAGTYAKTICNMFDNIAFKKVMYTPSTNDLKIYLKSSIMDGATLYKLKSYGSFKRQLEFEDFKFIKNRFNSQILNFMVKHKMLDQEKANEIKSNLEKLKINFVPWGFNEMYINMEYMEDIL